MDHIDLNNLGGGDHSEVRDHIGSIGQTEYLFLGLRQRLLLLDDAIRNGWDCFGAMAWLTDSLILNAMGNSHAPASSRCWPG